MIKMLNSELKEKFIFLSAHLRHVKEMLIKRRDADVIIELKKVEDFIESIRRNILADVPK